MDWIKQIMRFILVMLLQLLILNRMQVLGVCHPMLYVMCLMMMPITLPSQIDILIGALVGLLVDIFSNSPGVHMASCVLIMYLRRIFIRHLVLEPERLKGDIDLKTIGTDAYIKYMVVLVLLHHLTVFSLTAWSWSMFGWVLLETMLSALLTSMMILAYNAAKK